MAGRRMPRTMPERTDGVRITNGSVVKLQGDPGRDWSPAEVSTTRLFGSRAMQPKRTTRIRTCVECQSEFEQRATNQRFCSWECTQLSIKQNRPVRDYETTYDEGLPHQTKGALSELRVTVDLLSRGWHVFRSMSSSAPFDLVVALPDGRLVRLEVKTGLIHRNGTIQGGSYKSNVFYDAICIATRDKLVYDPPTEEW